jgi:hypothetical protein
MVKINIFLSYNCISQTEQKEDDDDELGVDELKKLIIFITNIVCSFQ